MAKIFFLSHSHEDSPIVTKIADELGEDACWLYEWEIRPGDSIFGFDRGIADSRIFIVFWSKNTSESEWVSEEINQARIRLSRDRGFRIVPVILDDTPLPNALQYRSYINGKRGQRYIVTAIQQIRAELIPEETFIGQPILRESFQNREKSLDELERYSFSNNSPVLVLGIKGIGKTSLIKKASVAIFSHLFPVWVDCQSSPSPIGFLSSIAKPLSIAIDIHELARDPYAFWESHILPEVQQSERLYVVIDNFRSASIAGYSRGNTYTNLVERICNDLAIIHKPDNPGLILISEYDPSFSTDLLKKFKTIGIGSLSDKSIARALRFHLSRISPMDYDLDLIESVAHSITGFPAAILPVAQKISAIGIEATISDTESIRNIRRALADEIFTDLELNTEEKNTLAIFSVSTYGLNEQDVQTIFKGKMQTIESIKQKQLFDYAESGYALHSILKEYALNNVFERKQILNGHIILARHHDNAYEKALPLSAEKARHASACHYHYLASGRKRHARLLEQDFIEEAKSAAIELYRTGEYQTALQYLDTVNSLSKVDDPLFEFYRGLSLNRLDRIQEAFDIIKSLTTRFPKVSRYFHALGTIQRNMADEEGAMASFRTAIALASERSSPTSLMSLADILSDQGDHEEAIALISKALEIDPGKTHTIGIATKVYVAAGKIREAISILYEAIRVTPDDARLHHRVGMLLKGAGQLKEAKLHLEEAIRDPSLRYSITALADVYFKLGDIDSAEKTLERYPGEKMRNPSYLSIKANIERHKGNYDIAEQYLNAALKIQPKDIVAIGGLAQVKFERALFHFDKGEKQLGAICIAQAKLQVEEGLKIDDKNETLLTIAHEISKLSL